MRVQKPMMITYLLILKDLEITHKMRIFQGLLHPLLKISMFCVLSQSYQHFFWNLYASYSKLSKELKNGIEIFVGQAASSYGSK